MKEKIKQLSRWPADVTEIRKVVSEWPWDIGMGVLKRLRSPPLCLGTSRAMSLNHRTMANNKGHERLGPSPNLCR